MNENDSPASPSQDAKPKSMVIPRCFSSARESVSIPVKARINVVFP